MHYLVQQYEKEQITKLVGDKVIPDFQAGDTVKVHYIITELSVENERIQAFEGVVIAKRNKGLGSSFVVRKISSGEGVERSFPLYSPKISRIEVLKKGRVRRSKIYYLRNLRGKAARIKEKTNY